MKSVISIFLLLTISYSFALRVLPIVYPPQPPSVIEKPQVIEIVRWRQPVCLRPAERVPSCSLDPYKVQKQRQHMQREVINVVQKGYTEITQSSESSSLEELESAIPTKLVSPEVVRSVPLDNLEPSQGEESLVEKLEQLNQKTLELSEEQEENIRRGRHVTLPVNQITKSQQIYVTKVLDSPVTATLVAYNCVPDIGVPLCPNYQSAIRPTATAFATGPTATVAVINGLDQKRPTSPYGVPEVSVFNQAYPGLVSRPIENARPDAAIGMPKFIETSSRFIVQGRDSVQQSNLHQAENSKNRLALSDIVFQPVNLETSAMSSSSIEHQPRILHTVRNFADPSKISGINEGIRNWITGSDDASKKAEESSLKVDVGGFWNKYDPTNLFDPEEKVATQISESAADVKQVVAVDVDEAVADAYANSRIPKDFEAGLSTDAKSVSAVDVQRELNLAETPGIVTDVTGELFADVESEGDTVTKSKLLADIDSEAATEIKSELLVGADSGAVQNVQDKLSLNTIPTIYLAMEPEIAAHVKRELSAGVESEAAREIKSELSAGAKLEAGVDAKAELPVDVKTEVAADVREESSAGATSNAAVDLKTDGERGISTNVRPIASVPDAKRKIVVDEVL